MIETLFSQSLPDVVITYVDAKDDVTHRKVSPIGVRRMKAGDPGLAGLCRLRGAMRTFSTTRMLSIDNMDRNALMAWMEKPLKRYDLFEYMLAGYGTPLTIPTCVMELHAALNHPLKEALIWWEGDTVRLDPDTILSAHIREQTGHRTLEMMAILQQCAMEVVDTLKNRPHEGAIGIDLKASGSMRYTPLLKESAAA